MRRPIITVLILIFGLISCNQNTSSNLDENQKFQELYGFSKEELTPKQVDDLAEYLNVEHLDNFIQLIQKKRYKEMYSLLDNDVKELQSEEDIIKYYNFFDLLYGSIDKISPSLYAVNKQTSSNNMVASANYDIVYQNCEGELQTAFEVVNKDSIILQALRININEGYQFYFFDSLTKPFFNSFLLHDFPAIYQLTSQKFQDYTSITKYEAFMSKVENVKIDSLLNIHRIGIVENKLILYLWYKSDFEEKDLKLTYVESEKGFEIEGITFQ